MLISLKKTWFIIQINRLFSYERPDDEIYKGKNSIEMKRNRTGQLQW